MDSQQKEQKQENNNDSLDDLPVDLDLRVVFATEIPWRAIAVDKKTKQIIKRVRKSL